MTAPDSLYQLVEKFERDKSRFKQPDYNETQLRVEFINPLFEALGWDVRDSVQVSHEDRVIVAGKPKRPDYGFRVNRVTRFYLETKKPALNLRDDPSPAYQLRRYGWSGNLPLSVLSDFEEFIIYDCRIQPQRSDPASKARLRYYQYGDYVDKWDEFDARFSRQAVADGALRAWIDDEKTRGALSVDEAFLREMEGWRETLARDMKLHNPSLERRELNLLVQRAIDRIVFLRIAEDRSIEPYGRLGSAVSPGRAAYEELKRLFHEADDKYNSGLFDFRADRLSLDIHISDDALRGIINKLYYPNSPYEFSVLPADILGQVYERFLGKVIQLSASGAVDIEEKPEARKAGGVYYTPTYIVDYIVENTVGKLLKDKTPAEAAKLRVLDPACGSGSFLTGAYQYLLDWHLEYYRAHPKQFRNRRRETADGMILSTAEKRRILLNSIYGVDLDQSAVEVTKLSLLLKMLENESEATGKQTLMFAAGGRILPDLGGNIKWGNSLIGSDFYRGAQMTLFDDEAVLRVKAFDWASRDGFGAIMAAGGFDAVIGNPPYVRPHKIEPEHKEYFWENYSGFVKKSDLYCCFIEKSIELLKDIGYYGMIVSNSWLRLDSFEKIRKIILDGTCVNNIIDFTNNVFGDAAVKTNILLLAKPHVNGNKIQIAVTSAPTDLSQLKFRILNQTLFETTYKNIFDLSIREEHEVIKQKMRSLGQELGDLFSLSFGLKTGDDSKFLTYEIGEDIEKYKRLLRGENISRYTYQNVGEYVWYVPQEMKKHRRTARPGTRERFEQPKVLVRDTGEGLQCTFENENHYVKDVLVVSDASKNSHQLKYITGLINSTLLRFYYETSFPTLHVQRNELASLPIRVIDFDNPADKAMHDKMVALVERMLDLHRQLPGLTAVQRGVVEAQIEATDREIDALVYALYGLSEDEVGVVEGG